MLDIRPLNATDYDTTLVEWWKDWGFTPVAKEFLPDNGTGGIMVFDDDINVCAGFLYLTNSSVGWVDWIISNRFYKKKHERRAAIDLLINILTKIAKDSGCKYAYSLNKNSQLVNRFERLGFTKGVTYTEELIKYL